MDVVSGTEIYDAPLLTIRRLLRKPASNKQVPFHEPCAYGVISRAWRMGSGRWRGQSRNMGFCLSLEEKGAS